MRVLVTGGSGFVGRALLGQLCAEGHAVRALVRSDEAQRRVEAEGAQGVLGDMAEQAALRAACEGVDHVVHLAALVRETGPRRLFYEVNVEGTRSLLEAARRAGARRFVHVSTEAVLLDGSPLVDVDETRPIPEAPIGPYAWSKALAEKLVSAADRPGFTCVALRPRLIWGKGDSTITPRLLEAVRGGKFAWIDGGAALTSTCHVRNVCAAISCALAAAAPGGVYFVTDGEPISFRAFFESVLRTHGVEPPTRSLPRWLALGAASLSEFAYARFAPTSSPPLTRTSVLLMGQQMTVDDGLARRVLGYRPVLSRQAGLSELAGEVLPAEPARPSAPPPAPLHGARRASSTQDGAPAQPTR
jgi:nucleoside-diphosphate-sugar epimerase